MKLTREELEITPVLLLFQNEGECVSFQILIPFDIENSGLWTMVACGWTAGLEDTQNCKKQSWATEGESGCMFFSR